MNKIKSSVEIISNLDREYIYKLIEQSGRTCYKSTEKSTVDSAEKFIRMLIANGHESVLEHFSITVKFIGSRAFSHQLVRHRLCSFSQESQRYVNYNKKGGINYIDLELECKDIKNKKIVNALLNQIEENLAVNYYQLIELGCNPEDARYILPNICKTEVVTTANIREWRHVFKERCSPKAQKEIRELMLDLLRQFREIIPVFFEDLDYE